MRISDNEDVTEKTEVTFRATRIGDSSNVFYFTGTPNGANRSAAAYINAESSPFSILIFFRQIFQIILTGTNCYFYQYMFSEILEALQHKLLILQPKKCTQCLDL
jgi:hypothetical protein